MTELCNESRFGKKIAGSLVELRNGVGDGLFTADTKSRGWQIGHRILMPVLGQTAIRDMFDGTFSKRPAVGLAN